MSLHALVESDRSKRNGRWEIMINADTARFEE